MRASAAAGFFIAVFLALATSVFASGQANLRLIEPTATDDLVVGQSVTLEIEVDRELQPNGWSMENSDSDNWFSHGPLYLDPKSISPRLEPTRKIQIKGVFTQAGAVTVPSFTVQILEPRQQLLTNSLELRVRSALDAEDEAAEWMAPPIPFGSWNFSLIAAIGLAGAAFLAGIIYFSLRYSRKRGTMRDRSPTERALTELIELEKFLEARRELDLKDCKTLSFGISATLRRYCTGVYDTDFLELTDAEVTKKLEEISVPQKTREEISAILRLIAEVRYSRQLIAVDAASGILSRTRGLIHSIEMALKAAAEKENERKAK